ncbi:C-type lectin-like domain-containing protein [Neorhodopirellula pilleata]|uniref:J domain-containing protein n=1 Tax=Neorhodopirellula pilleata TaxID=2714738 RepID=A0A5C6ASQ5_9BACT|nr:hypothetical protein [Neorhodopirellula pilleata]TWU02096.1 hypothetical protein Pla100_18360 [Neorhodopirellula pilleata]
MQHDNSGEASQYDPYHKLLGIPKRDQPPTLYRLLGVESLESDRDVIDAAANKQMAYLRDCCNGLHAEQAERLLNEVSEARLRLLNPQSKQQYDAQLHARVAPQQQSSPTTGAPTIHVHASSRPRRKRSSSFGLILSVLVPSGLSLLIAWKTGLLTQQHLDVLSKPFAGSMDTESIDPAVSLAPSSSMTSPASSSVRGVDDLAASSTSQRGAITASGTIPHSMSPGASAQTNFRPEPSAGVTSNAAPNISSSDAAMERLRAFRMLASGGGGTGPSNHRVPYADGYFGPRLPMPTPEQISISMEEVETIFAPKIAAAQTPHEKRHFATNCYLLVDETPQTAAKYVLLEISWKFFREANDFTGAMLALDSMASRFEANVDSKRSATIIELVTKLYRPSEQLAAADQTEAMARVALMAEDYPTLIELGRIGKRLAIDFKNISMNKKFASLIEEALVLQQAHPMVEAARERLRLEPDNPKANEYLGRFLCFGKSDWGNGLPMLRRAENTKLATMAELELQMPSDAASAEKLADQWWEFAALLPGEPALAMEYQERAVHWYQHALNSGLSGLSRAAAQTRIDTYSQENKERLDIRSAPNADLRTPTPPRGVPPEAIHFDGNWYLFSTKTLRFEAAVAMATQAGGRLVVVRSEAENEFVSQHARRPLMLGMLRKDGVWYDALGEMQYFFMWDQQAGQPEGLPNEPLAAMYRRTHLWHDFTDEPMYFAIEWGKE